MRRERSEGIQNRQGRAGLFKTADLNPGPTVFQKGRYEENPNARDFTGREKQRRSQSEGKTKERTTPADDKKGARRAGVRPPTMRW